ncbi:MAG: hypothetical protein OXI44_05955 [Bacteroidota bacterium]|nr:hypothetical protein [Bacteroidota bacterium]
MGYVGSRFSDALDDPALPGLFEELKDEFLRRSVDLNISFSVVGVGIDWLRTDGWKHLSKYGAFDELIVGRKWDSIRARQFVEEGIVGTRAAPWVLVCECRKLVYGGKDTNARESVMLARKLGISQIRNWVDRGAPISSLQ